MHVSVTIATIKNEILQIVTNQSSYCRVLQNWEYSEQQKVIYIYIYMPSIQLNLISTYTSYTHRMLALA